MNQRENDRFKMLKACLNKLNAFNSVWMNNPVLVALVATLQGFINQVIAAEAQQKADISGTVQAKNAVRDTLRDSLLKCASAGYGYASNTRNVQLKAGCIITPSTLNTMPDVDLLACAQNLHGLLSPLISSLANWGIAAADLASLQNNRASLMAMMNQYENVRASRTQATGDIETLVGNACAFMNEQMDNTMAQYKTSHADFYGQYFIARGINTHGHHKTVVVHVHISDSRGQAIALCDVDLHTGGGKERHKLSKGDGTCLFTRLNPDTVTISVSKPRYVTQRKTEVVTSPQRIDLFFVLAPSGHATQQAA